MIFNQETEDDLYIHGFLEPTAKEYFKYVHDA